MTKKNPKDFIETAEVRRYCAKCKSLINSTGMCHWQCEDDGKSLNDRDHVEKLFLVTWELLKETRIAAQDYEDRQ